MLSETKATPQKIAAITGHSIKSVTEILDKYLAFTRHLTEGAMALFRTQGQPHLQTNCKPSLRRARKE